jgi:LysM domain
MTERGLPIVEGAPACPFVAFEDDRDERAASPDHRHRCYAEARPAPRALAHQEAYCLSSAFSVCPTFQDWARREAAHSRADGPRPIEAAAMSDDEQPQRNPPRNWSAPPPWAAGGAAADDAWANEGGAGEDDVARRGRGLSGSYADRVASGASAGGEDPGIVNEDGDDERGGEHDAAGEAGDATPPRRERRRDSGAPEWERARPLEVYPTLRARRLPELSVPPLLVAVVAIALAAAVLFALPGILGFGSPSAVSSPSPSPAASVEATFEATPIPVATPQIYIVQSGDTMSKIAKKFHVPLGDLIAANAENIPNANRLQIGDQVIIPVPQPSELPEASPASS